MNSSSLGSLIVYGKRLFLPVVTLAILGLTLHDRGATKKDDVVKKDVAPKDSISLSVSSPLAVGRQIVIKSLSPSPVSWASPGIEFHEGKETKDSSGYHGSIAVTVSSAGVYQVGALSVIGGSITQKWVSLDLSGVAPNPVDPVKPPVKPVDPEPVKPDPVKPDPIKPDPDVVAKVEKVVVVVCEDGVKRTPAQGKLFNDPNLRSWLFKGGSEIHFLSVKDSEYVDGGYKAYGDKAGLPVAVVLDKSKISGAQRPIDFFQVIGTAKDFQDRLQKLLK